MLCPGGQSKAAFLVRASPLSPVWAGIVTTPWVKVTDVPFVTAPVRVAKEDNP